MNELNTQIVEKKNGDVIVIDVSFRTPGTIEVVTTDGPIILNVRNLFETLIENTNDLDIDGNSKLGMWATDLQSIALMLRSKEQTSARKRHEDWVMNSGHLSPEQQEALLSYKWKDKK